MNKPSRSRSNRRGASAVEFALVAPIVIVLFFAAYEFSRMNMLRHTIDIAAYEGARQGIIPGATSAEIRQRVGSVLRPMSVRQFDVQLNPRVIERNTERITVTVEVPLGANDWLVGKFTDSLRLQSSSTLAREGFTSPGI